MGSVASLDESGETDDHGGEGEHLETIEQPIEQISELSEMAVAISLDCFGEEEAWKDSVKKCKHGKLDVGGEDAEEGHHSKYLETSDPQVEGRIKKMICIMFEDGELYSDILGQLLKQEYECLNKNLSALQEKSQQNLPDQLRIASYAVPIPMLLKQYRDVIQISLQKREDRMANALQYFYKELDNVTRDIMRKVDGVVRVQRKTTESREHGTGTGIVVRLNRSGTCYTPPTPERDDFVILTNNHVIANDIEAKGSTIDFFYNRSASNETQGQPPPGVITKSVKKVITWSPQVPHGTPASSEKMDFSILKFDVGTDEEFVKKLGDVSFYLNEFLENDLPDRPWISYFYPLPLVAISHPHGSNKRISFGKVEKTEVDKLCCEDNEDCSSKYDLTTCLGSSGCPVLAILVNSRGRLKAVFQFLHFKTQCGIDVSKVYSACKTRKKINNEFWLFENILNSREQMLPLNPTAAWWDAEDRSFGGF